MRNLQQAGGHTALAFAGGCLQQGDQTLGLQPSPELPSLMQDVIIVGIMVGGGCFWESRQVVAGLCWRWSWTTVDNDSCHIFSNHLQAIQSSKVTCCWLG